MPRRRDRAVPKRGPLAQLEEEQRLQRPRGGRPASGGVGVSVQAPVAAKADVQLAPLETDDPVVIAAAQRALAIEVRGRRPMHVSVVRIDNWFSRRWLTFAGKLAGAVRVTSSRLVIPPFVPGRVVRETHLRWDDASASYVVSEDSPAFHVDQTSAENLRRRLALRGASCVALWLGVSTRDGRAAAMLYAVGPPAADAWYVSLARDGGTWDVDFASPLSVPDARSRLFDARR